MYTGASALGTNKVVSKYFENLKNNDKLITKGMEPVIYYFLFFFNVQRLILFYFLKGFMLLQRDIIRVKCHQFLQDIRFLALGNNAATTSVSPFTAFISYAWPQDITDRNHLQNQLLQLVEDLSHAGIRTLLDIMQLHPGSDVKKFMQVEIDNSHTVLWIGTPDLKARVKFDKDGKPETNAAIEFGHIKSKLDSIHPPDQHAQTQTLQPILPPPLSSSPPTVPWTIQSLLFRGNSPIESFPSDFSRIKSTFHDFTKETTYYTHLPKLVASIFGIPLESPNFREAYNSYFKNVNLWEASFTETAI